MRFPQLQERVEVDGVAERFADRLLDLRIALRVADNLELPCLSLEADLATARGSNV
jgi:hypothetical protein